ncbi:MAG: hypothetical protein QXJ64_05370, partial [Thermosphaera sp.]
MSYDRLKEILIGICMMLLAGLLILQNVKVILYIRSEPWYVNMLIIIVICFFFSLLGSTAFIIGFKLIRYKSIIRRDIYNIQKLANKYFSEYIDEVLGNLNIIIFSGVDGSGKTTQAKLLEKFLREKQVKVRIFWFRWFAFFSYFLYFYAFLLRRTIKIKILNKSLKIHAFYIDIVLQRLYPVFQSFDLLLKYLFTILYIKLRRIRVIIFDRFVLDLIVDLLWETRNHRILRNVFLRVLLQKMLKGCVIVFTV